MAAASRVSTTSGALVGGDGPRWGLLTFNCYAQAGSEPGSGSYGALRVNARIAGLIRADPTARPPLATHAAFAA